jgi:hypothetical protein
MRVDARRPPTNYHEPQIPRRDNPQDVDHDVHDERPEDQVGFSNRDDQRQASTQRSTSAYSVRRTAQFSAVERSESPYSPIMVNNTRGRQSSGQSQSSGQLIAADPRPRTHLRESVAACEFDIERFKRETNAGPAFFSNEPETYKLSDGSGGDAQGASGSELCQRSPTRDRLDGGAHDNGGSEWLRRPRTRPQDRKGRDNGVSVAASSAGSGGSRSLDAHKRDRDVIVARLEFQRAREKTRRAELQLADLDAEAGLSRRSRNSSQASSLHSGGRSILSGARRSSTSIT